MLYVCMCVFLFFNFLGACEGSRRERGRCLYYRRPANGGVEAVRRLSVEACACSG